MISGTGSNNVIIGKSAGEAGSFSGSSNTAIGYYSGSAITTGNNNVTVGANAGDSNTSASDNTLIGYNCGQALTTNGASTYVGSNAGQLTTGGVNTFIGANAGANMTTGSYNICLGYAANSSSNSSSGQCTLGDSNIGNLRCNDTSISSLSDRRDKTDIVDLPIGLDFVNTLQPRKFKWETRDGNIKDGSVRAGFIAQELQEAQSDCNYMQLVLEDNPEKLEANEGHLIPVLVNAIKELSTKNDALEARIKTLEG